MFPLTPDYTFQLQLNWVPMGKLATYCIRQHLYYNTQYVRRLYDKYPRLRTDGTKIGPKISLPSYNAASSNHTCQNIYIHDRFIEGFCVQLPNEKKQFKSG